MAFVDGRIIFSEVKGFPIVNDSSKIQMQGFLDGAKEVVSMIQEFDNPLKNFIVYDMNGNIEKVRSVFIRSEINSPYLGDILRHEMRTTPEGTINQLIDGILWLQRGLELLETFFRKVANDTTLQENLENHLREAYAETLQPYNGIIVQTALLHMFNYIPARSKLIGSEENVTKLVALLDPLRSHLNWINEFYTEHNLHYRYHVNNVN